MVDKTLPKSKNLPQTAPQFHPFLESRIIARHEVYETAQTILPRPEGLDEKNRPHNWWIRFRNGSWALLKIAIGEKDVVRAVQLQHERALLTRLQNVPGLNVPHIINLPIDIPGYLALDVILGSDLQEFLIQMQDKIALSPNWLLNLTFHLLAQVEYVHEQGLVHLDIKPGNIIIEPTDLSQEQKHNLTHGESIPVLGSEYIVGSLINFSYKLYLIDYGISMAPGLVAYEEGTSVGTPGFCHPDLANGGLVDVQPDYDVYGVAQTILYMMQHFPRHKDKYTSCLETITQYLQSVLDNQAAGTTIATMRRELIKIARDYGLLASAET
jgi:serine/threonine protein kinase